MKNQVQIQQELSDIVSAMHVLGGDINDVWNNLPEAANVEIDRLLAIIDGLYKQINTLQAQLTACQAAKSQ